MKAVVWLLLALACPLSAAQYRQIPADQLQVELNRQFPIRKDLMFAQVQFSEPDLRLPASGERAGLALQLKVLLPGQTIAGDLLVAGGLLYQPASRQFLLAKPQLVQLNLPSLPQAYQQPVRELILQLLQQPLPKSELVRQLRDKALAQQLQQPGLHSAGFQIGRAHV